MKVQNCNKCRLSEHRTKIVNGKGNPKASMVFVGEAPGKEEDEKGAPFVGSAGRVLYAIIKEAGLNFKDIWFTNVCRCRPPNNRTPEFDEIEACKNNLLNELDAIAPKYVVALGDTAAKLLTGRSTKMWRGYLEPHREGDSWRTLITSHPARTFHEREYFQIIVWDLMKLTCDWEGYRQHENYLVNPSHPEISYFLDKATISPWVAVDIETVVDKDEYEDSGLNPMRDSILGIGFCTAEGVALSVSGSTMKAVWQEIKEFLETHNGLIYQNNRFDRTFLKVAGINSKCAWDTLTGMYLLNPDFPQRNLFFLRSIYTNIAPYKDEEWMNVSTERTGYINCKDVDVTLEVMQMQHTFTPEDLMERMMGESDVAIGMTYRGVRVNTTRLAEHYLSMKPDMDRISSEFYSEFGVEIGSNKQLSTLFYERLKLPYLHKKVKKTMISVDEEALTYAKLSLFGGQECFPTEWNAIEKVLEYRGLQKLCSTYCEGIMRQVGVDGRIHPAWKPEGTDTGRWSCKDPNPMNMPDPMKDIIIAGEGKVFLYADYDRLEVWISALISGDKELIDLLESGVDIHGVLQAEIKKVYPPITRMQAKTTLFGIYYGRGDENIAQEFNIPVEIVREWKQMIFGRFKQLGEFFTKRIPEEFNSKGYMTSFYGRVKYPANIMQAMNFPIQSCASDTLNNALIALHKAGFHPILNQHDACVCEEDDTSRWEEFIEIMQTSSPLLRKIMPASGGMGYNWRELVDDEMHKAIELEFKEGASVDQVKEKWEISELALSTIIGIG